MQMYSYSQWTWDSMKGAYFAFESYFLFQNGSGAKPLFVPTQNHFFVVSLFFQRLHDHMMHQLPHGRGGVSGVMSSSEVFIVAVVIFTQRHAL